MAYTIETRTPGNRLHSEWDRDAVGDRTSNTYETRAEAERVIEELRALGEDWAAAEYRVVKIA